MIVNEVCSHDLTYVNSVQDNKTENLEAKAKTAAATQLLSQCFDRSPLLPE